MVLGQKCVLYPGEEESAVEQPASFFARRKLVLLSGPRETVQPETPLLLGQERGLHSGEAEASVLRETHGAQKCDQQPRED